MATFDDIPDDIRALIITDKDVICKWRLVSKELNHICRFAFAHKRSYITRYEMLEYALQPEQEFALRIDGDMVYFNKLGYAMYEQESDGSIKKYPTNKVDLHTFMNKHYNARMVVNEHNRITGIISYDTRFHTYDLRIDIDLLSKSIILRNRGYDPLIRDYTKTYTIQYLKYYKMGMYSMHTRYSNYLILLANARIYGICALTDKEEYTKNEIVNNNYDKRLYKLLETILKI